MKLLTVTVPCYNSQDYLKPCIDSLLTGGDRVEVIIINDGSKDQTGPIADRYAAEHPNIIKVIHQENGGHGEGINQGLRHATGKYFKVVDSDDKLSDDFPAFLDALEECDRQGGVDIFVTNYFYVHEDGVGDRSIRYANALPEDRVVTWDETKRFRLHQLLTLHSSTFRTELMRKWEKELPQHVFYEDNLMVCQTLPHTKTLYYRDSDLYRYTIGREGQSVSQAMQKKRYSHQILVARRCFEACRLDRVDSKRLRKYMYHELFMMFGIAITFARLNRDDESDRALEQMWADCRALDKKQADKFRKYSPLWFICIPGKFGRGFTNFIYNVAYKVVRFN